MLLLKDEQMVEYLKNYQKVKDIAYDKGTQVLIFQEELRRLARICLYNFPGMFAQAWHETGGFTSDPWKFQKNPAGIKKATGNTYQKYVNGVDSARAMVVHFSAYVPPANPVILKPYLYLDERYNFALSANQGRIFKTFIDLTGRWATDPSYGKKIEGVYRELYGSGTTHF